MDKNSVNSEFTSGKNRKKYLLYLLIIVPLFVSGFVSFSLLQAGKSGEITQPTENTQTPQSTTISSQKLNDIPVNYPGEKIDPENEGKHKREAFRKAEVTDEIDIGECLPIPQIARVPQNATVTIHNSNTQDHIIRLSPTISYTIPARDQIEIKADFGKGEGIYYYNCDDSSLPAGMFIVESS